MGNIVASVNIFYQLLFRIVNTIRQDSILEKWFKKWGLVILDKLIIIPIKAHLDKKLHNKIYKVDSLINANQERAELCQAQPTEYKFLRSIGLSLG